MAEKSVRHHYVPRFYLRQFALENDLNKVSVLERHRRDVVVSRKSIGGIGFEENLHDYDDGGASGSIEPELNALIETPFSRSATWCKIREGRCAELDETDRFPLYVFARHLQLRNLETLRFIEKQTESFAAGELDDELTDEERAMHRRMAAEPSAAHALFRAGALDTLLPPDAEAINVMVCRSDIPVRSSTNPAIRVSYPGLGSIYGSMFDQLRTWWLSLDRHWGVFLVLGGPSGFSSRPVEPDVVRVLNRLYLTQLLEGGARYLIADDASVAQDLAWAGFERIGTMNRYRDSRTLRASGGI